MSHNRLSNYFEEWEDTPVATNDEQPFAGHSVPAGFAVLPPQMLAGMDATQVEGMRRLYERAYAEAKRQTRKSFINRLTQYFADGDGV